MEPVEFFSVPVVPSVRELVVPDLVYVHVDYCDGLVVVVVVVVANIFVVVVAVAVAVHYVSAVAVVGDAASC